MSTTHTSPAPVYTNYFEVHRADGTSMIDDSYRIRYQVYCEERSLLDPNDYSDQSEMDRFDSHSIHFVVRHRVRLHAAGTVRLVRFSALGFPMQEHCVFDPDYRFLEEPGHPAARNYAEISRLSVSKLFRRRAGDTLYGESPRDQRQGGAADNGNTKNVNPPQAGPEIIAGLYKSIYQDTKRLGITHWLVAMERGLEVLLRRMGYYFKPIGPVADYYGPVTPYITRIDEFERLVYEKRRAVFDYWMEGLESEFVTIMDVPPEASTQSVSSDAPATTSTSDER